MCSSILLALNCKPVAEAGSVKLRSMEGTGGACSPSPGDGRGLLLEGWGLSAGLPSTTASIESLSDVSSAGYGAYVVSKFSCHCLVFLL